VGGTCHDTGSFSISRRNSAVLFSHEVPSLTFRSVSDNRTPLRCRRFAFVQDFDRQGSMSLGSTPIFIRIKDTRERDLFSPELLESTDEEFIRVNAIFSDNLREAEPDLKPH